MANMEVGRGSATQAENIERPPIVQQTPERKELTFERYLEEQRSKTRESFEATLRYGQSQSERLEPYRQTADVPRFDTALGSFLDGVTRERDSLDSRIAEIQRAGEARNTLDREMPLWHDIEAPLRSLDANIDALYGRAFPPPFGDETLRELEGSFMRHGGIGEEVKQAVIDAESALEGKLQRREEIDVAALKQRLDSLRARVLELVQQVAEAAVPASMTGDRALADEYQHYRDGLQLIESGLYTVTTRLEKVS